MRQIEIVGMRKNRDVKIVITIIILAIISIIVCTGIVLYNKHKRYSSVETLAGLDGANSQNAEMAGEGAQEGHGGSSINEENNSKGEEGNDGNVNEIVPEKGNTEEITEEEKAFIDEIDNIYNGEEGKRVFLTFDDGPSQEVTPRILNILDKYNIKATFFVLGNRVKIYPEIVKREYEDGHYIANHGYSHKYSKIYKNVSSVLSEYYKTEEAIQEALENQNYSSGLFRFPGGSVGGEYDKIKKQARKKLKQEGIAYLDWSALTYDAEGAKTKKEILTNLKKTLNGWNNVVILMHDASDKQITYKTLEDVIKYLQKEGYAFKNIYDLKK